MENKTLIFCFCVSAFFVLLGYTINYFRPEDLPGTYLILVMEGLAYLFGLFIILRTSTIQHTYYFRILLICLSTILIGTLITIQHWGNGRVIILIALSTGIVTYSFRFIQKKRKSFNDMLKLFLVFSYCLSFGFTIEHWKYGHALNTIFQLIFLFVIVSSIYQITKSSRLGANAQ